MPSRRRLDPVDESIVTRLARDARISNRQIADDLGVTEGTVRARIKRMEEEKQIRITAEPQVIPTNCLFRVDRCLSVATLYTSDAEWAVTLEPTGGGVSRAAQVVR